MAYEKDEKPKKKDDDRALTWPNLTALVFLCMIAACIGLFVTAALVNAPLEGPADPTNTPNPSKAPWYFIGLQEMLVYFDPWIAGVAAPSIIIVGLMLIPYIDTNHKGVGVYNFRSRKFATRVFCFGFFMWHLLIIVGVFFRGPGWVFFPGGPDTWDPHVEVFEAFRNFHEFFGFSLSDPWYIREIPGIAALAVWFLGGIVVPLKIPARVPLLGRIGEFCRRLYAGTGAAKYAITMTLFMMMFGFFMKIILRLLPFIVLKYLVTTPYVNI